MELNLLKSLAHSGLVGKREPPELTCGNRTCIFDNCTVLCLKNPFSYEEKQLLPDRPIKGLTTMVGYYRQEQTLELCVCANSLTQILQTEASFGESIHLTLSLPHSYNC